MNSKKIRKTIRTKNQILSIISIRATKIPLPPNKHIDTFDIKSPHLFTFSLIQIKKKKQKHN